MIPSSPPTWAGVKLVLSSIGLLLTLNTISSLYALGPRAVTFNTALILTLFVVSAWRRKDRLLWRWLAFGVVAGFGELVADWWLVSTGTLVYPANEPMIWASPAYMPFAWAMVLVQVGYLGSWIATKMSFLKASVLTALLAGINIPVYEHLANGAKWWYYQNTPQLFDAPYYVIVAEFLLALPLVWIGTRLESRRLAWLPMGCVEGAVMLAAVWIGFRMVGPCQGALIQLSCS